VRARMLPMLYNMIKMVMPLGSKMKAVDKMEQRNPLTKQMANHLMRVFQFKVELSTTCQLIFN